MHDSGNVKHRKRGRHKRSSSPETKRWETEHLIPERPVWMPPEVYVKLAEMRNG
jgi:hypothetical protein